MNCGHEKAVKLLSELDTDKGCGLIERMKQGQGKPTKIYVKSALAACKACDVHGIAHITGGGFIENIPRILPDGLSAQIKRGTWDVLPVFTELMRLGGLEDRQAYNTFNMGIGMVFAVAPEEADKLVASLEESGEKAYRIGQVAKTGEDGERLVLL